MSAGSEDDIKRNGSVGRIQSNQSATVDADIISTASNRLVGKDTAGTVSYVDGAAVDGSPAAGYEIADDIQNCARTGIRTARGKDVGASQIAVGETAAGRRNGFRRAAAAADKK